MSGGGHRSDRRAGVWFERQERWRAELNAFRAILLDAGLDEAFKWRGPCYVAHGSNVAVVWSLKDAAGLGLFRGVLLDDPAGLLTAPGPNSRAVRVVRVTDVAEIAAREAEIRALVRGAVALARAGTRVPLPADDLDLPEELSERLAADDAFREAWETLTPGRRRGYVVHIGGAKQAATREARIERHAGRIMAGLGMHDRDGGPRRTRPGP